MRNGMKRNHYFKMALVIDCSDYTNRAEKIKDRVTTLERRSRLQSFSSRPRADSWSPDAWHPHFTKLSLEQIYVMVHIFLKYPCPIDGHTLSHAYQMPNGMNWDHSLEIAQCILTTIPITRQKVVRLLFMVRTLHLQGSKQWQIEYARNAVFFE